MVYKVGENMTDSFWKPLKEYKGFESVHGDLLFIDHKNRLVLIPYYGGRWILHPLYNNQEPREELSYDWLIKISEWYSEIDYLPEANVIIKRMRME